jgi:hypothetical protein
MTTPPPPEPAFLDGNTAAGPLREIFALEMTAASGRCSGCGHEAVLAEAHLYAQAPGLIVRCAHCEGVLLRLVRGPDRVWLDLRGVSYLQFSGMP